MNDYLLISDAAKEVQVESHVLRYWEEELGLPIKRNELGHRFYTREDVELFCRIKDLKERGLQLKAVKMMLQNGRLDVTGGVSLERESLSRGESHAEREWEAGRDTYDVYGEKGQASGKDSRDSYEERGRISGRDAYLVREQVSERDSALGRNQGQEGSMRIEILESRELAENAKEDRAKRLQWILRQMIREAVRENNQELCNEIKDSVVKELDYQFRMQEEREEQREQLSLQRNEEYYKKVDELLRKKSMGIVEPKKKTTFKWWMPKAESKEQATAAKPSGEKGGTKATIEKTDEREKEEKRKGIS